jgi:hypothetical protein
MSTSLPTRLTLEPFPELTQKIYFNATFQAFIAVFSVAKTAYYGMTYADKIWLGKKSVSFQLTPEQAIAFVIALVKGVGSKRRFFISAHFLTTPSGKIVGRAKGRTPITVTG